MTKLYKKYLTIIENGDIQEKEIISLRSALNNKRFDEDEQEDLLNRLYDNEMRISSTQTEKGLKWLLNEWKTPRGIERKNNPFGYREEDILTNFSHFTLSGLYDAINSFQYDLGIHNYLPVYTVYAKDGNSFEYYTKGGIVEIVG